MERATNFVLIIAMIVLGICYLGAISKRSYWKERCFEIQDNYEAISKENEALQDSIYRLNRINVSPIIITKHAIYADTFQLR